MLYRDERSRWIGGLICIVIIYSLFYLLFAESEYTFAIPRKIRHVIKFGATVAVYLIGTHHLGQIKDKWMSSLWHFIHISLLCFITSMGLYDWTVGELSLQTKQFTQSMQEILISPVLYCAMGLVNKRFKSSS